MEFLKRYKAAPLPSSFFLISILGMLITIFYWNKIDKPDWTFTFLLVFALMFIASIISMSKAPIEAQLELDRKKRKKK